MSRSKLGFGVAVALLALVAAPQAAEAAGSFGRVAVRMGMLETASKAEALVGEESAAAATATAIASESSAVTALQSELSEESSALAAAKAKADALKAVVDADQAKLAEQRAALINAQSAALAGAPVATAAAAPAPSMSSEQAELEAIREQAERQAAETIRAATATAKELVARAKAQAESSDCGENCGTATKKNDEWRDVVLLTPTSATDLINDDALGLAPVMSVDTPTIRHAGDVLKKAENFHDKFIDEQERNCATGVCPLNQNFRVGV